MKPEYLVTRVIVIHELVKEDQFDGKHAEKARTTRYENLIAAEIADRTKSFKIESITETIKEGE